MDHPRVRRRGSGTMVTKAVTRYADDALDGPPTKAMANLMTLPMRVVDLRAVLMPRVRPHTDTPDDRYSRLEYRWPPSAR